MALTSIKCFGTLSEMNNEDYVFQYHKIEVESSK